MEQVGASPGLIPLGTTVSFAKTIGETDIYLFAGISGDFSPNHVNAEYMAGTRYGRIVAHGVLTIALMSTCSTKIVEQADLGRTVVSYGYDRVRFVKPVFVGDTITVVYEIVAEDLDKAQTRASVMATNQHGEVVAVATHILQYL
ncbi:MAG: MaoC family dehydratase N-terminal domain-containing protein [Thermomicrobiales bacterium]|nr:MaoC family dehydratase N-terminal domain-containing protein [Thermomicrobiales bacterium]